MNGFLCLYKRSGITSFKAVSEIRRATGQKKLGHTGTLDPMAQGVLPIAFGRAAKFIELLPDNEKEYTASFRLGTRTDTLDITGTVTEEREVTVTESDVVSALPAFTGDIMQVPPMYSAVSVDGVRLYKLAREGAEIERQARKIHIEKIDYLGKISHNEYKIHVRCGKGTYIRSLIDDIGMSLGCGAVMTGLTRTFSNGFDISGAVTVQQVEDAAQSGTPESLLIPVDRVLGVYPALTLSEKQERLFRNGVPLDVNRVSGAGNAAFYRVYSLSNTFLGVSEKNGELLKMKKMYDI